MYAKVCNDSWNIIIVMVSYDRKYHYAFRMGHMRNSNFGIGVLHVKVTLIHIMSSDYH